jgi:carboxyl-terminal processing protease
MTLSGFGTEDQRQWKAQKKIVILQNEGTASAAEVFVSSLKDNARLVGTVGSKTYGKGLIQHTLPLPDGGGLRLTVAEYLTPSLQHVTKIGGAKYDQRTGKYVGGGLLPDVQCDSRGIPSNIGADLCVGVALDMLEDTAANVENNGVKSEGGVVKII